MLRLCRITLCHFPDFRAHGIRASLHCVQRCPSSSFHISSSCCFFLSSTSSSDALKVFSSSLIFLMRLSPRIIIALRFSSAVPWAFSSSARTKTSCSLCKIPYNFCHVLLSFLTSDSKSHLNLEYFGCVTRNRAGCGSSKQRKVWPVEAKEGPSKQSVEEVVLATEPYSSFCGSSQCLLIGNVT